MVKVITYGTYDLLHSGHRRLLERAKALGDYLIVGVTADDFDRRRGKLNVQQSLMERLENVKSTGLADKVIVEEYEGQKIDDIKRYGVDVFTVGSDWEGKFDYLNNYCQVIYLPRTEGVSSTKLRMENSMIKFGIKGEARLVKKYAKEAAFVNGLEVSSLLLSNDKSCSEDSKSFAVEKNLIVGDYDTLLENCEAVCIISNPKERYSDVRKALLRGHHVLCEAPLAISSREYNELTELASSRGLILMDGLKTAYATAYNRLLLLIQSGRIGKVVSVDAVCTSMNELLDLAVPVSEKWESLSDWGPMALLPVFQILGTGYSGKEIISFRNQDNQWNAFTKIDFIYPEAVASIKVGKGVKSEGSLVISGTQGYIYVPAPWWKTDYFEMRFENPVDNKRYFYQLEGEGIRFMLLSFLRKVKGNARGEYLESNVSRQIVEIMDDYYQKNDFRAVTL